MGREKRRAGMAAAWGFGVWLAVLLVGAGPGMRADRAFAQEVPPAASQEEPAPVRATCVKAEFENAVDEAAESLRDLNNRNRPEFQAKLRKLKEKRAWTDNQFLKEAAPFVKDDRITVFDDKSNELLASISSMGQEGANAKEPDCTVLAKLRELMKVLIETQAGKWAYMFKKLDEELAK